MALPLDDFLIDAFNPDSIVGRTAADTEQKFNLQAIQQLQNQFGRTETDLNPFIEAGNVGLQNFQQGSTVQGLDEILGQIFGSENFKNLVGERRRAVEGQVSASGLSRSGVGVEEIANVPTDLGFQLEQLFSNRNQELARGGLNASLNLGNLRQNNAGNIANLTRGIGESKASGQIFDKQADAAAEQSTTNTLLQAAGIAASIFAFSDPRLKKNKRRIGKIKGLNLYSWEWIDAAKKTIVGKYLNMGFMSDEVKAKFPQYVKTYCGLDVVNYPGLLNELEVR